MVSVAADGDTAGRPPAAGHPPIKGRELPGFDVAAAWLRAHRPIDYIPGLMHGDYQLANVMFRHGAPARLAAIVDWEMGTCHIRMGAVSRDLSRDGALRRGRGG